MIWITLKLKNAKVKKKVEPPIMKKKKLREKALEIHFDFIHFCNALFLR